MSLLKKLEIAENFSESEKSIAQYILQNSEEVLNLSTIELAKKHIHPRQLLHVYVKSLILKVIMISKFHYQQIFNMFFLIKIVLMLTFHLIRIPILPILLIILLNSLKRVLMKQCNY